MTSLHAFFLGAQDKYFSNPQIKPITLESEYLDTVKNIVVWNPTVPTDSVPEEVRTKYTTLTEKLRNDPTEYAESYTLMKREYQAKGYWQPLTTTQAPTKPTNKSRVVFDGMRRSDIGFTGLRFVGTPSSVESIRFEVGGQVFDRMYPAITGTFEPFPIFDTIVPNPVHHSLLLEVEFREKEVPLEIYYERVVIDAKYPLKMHESIIRSTQYCGAEKLSRGPGRIQLNYNHPIEEIKFFSTAPLTNTYVTFNTGWKLYVPCKGMQNGFHLYELHFNGTVNFSRIDSAKFHFDASEETVLYPFAKSLNVIQFLSGMAGLAFSK